MKQDIFSLLKEIGDLTKTVNKMGPLNEKLTAKLSQPKKIANLQ